MSSLAEFQTCGHCPYLQACRQRSECLAGPIRYSDSGLSPESSQSILDEAASLVNGDRQAAYGHPRDNHACTADLWSRYIVRRDEALKEQGKPLEIDAFDVCMLNILQKVSRLAHSRTRDGLVDLAGFAANADMVDG